jgi:ABC-type Fe3+-hydroxamate transport system substrate-binding protein
VIQEQPEVIICSQSLVPQIEQMAGWKSAVPAVANTAYFHTSPNATFFRPGKRLAQAAEELARFLHPELYQSNGQPAPYTQPSGAASSAR